MRYSDVVPATFLDRPNRFIADILVDGAVQRCHVKNTGRCRELLVPGAKIWVQRCGGQDRKTAFDLVTVRKGERLINVDSTAPNVVCREWLEGDVLGELSLIKREQSHGDSRFDFYYEGQGRRGYAEVKGVTLEEDNVVRFPDAPTQRGVKHLNGLIRCVQEGYEACALFVIQMQGVQYFEPNRRTHPEFADALMQAQSAGVKLFAIDCRVTENEITPGEPVEIRLG